MGDDNIFIFGHEAEKLQVMRVRRDYRPQDCYDHDPRIKRIVGTFLSALFCPQEAGLFEWIYEDLLNANDAYFHVADLSAYLEAQEKAGAAFCDWDKGTTMSILNVTRIGNFSSDCVVAEYARDIWDINPV